MTMKKPNASKFTDETKKIILDCLAKGNFRKTACKLANVDESTLSCWLKNPKPSHQAFAKQVQEVEAKVESDAVGRILEFGHDDPKWLCWYLERKHKHWNIAVHRWEFAVLQKQLKQLKKVIDELQSFNPPDRQINTACLEPQKAPFIDPDNSN